MVLRKTALTVNLNCKHKHVRLSIRGLAIFLVPVRPVFWKIAIAEVVLERDRRGKMLPAVQMRGALLGAGG
jgi:hypothetical protein